MDIFTGNVLAMLVVMFVIPAAWWVCVLAFYGARALYSRAMDRA